MKRTDGFITDDGTFFESELEAKLYEAESRLRGALAVQFPQLQQEPFFVILLECIAEIREYINANDATQTNTEPVSDHAEEPIRDETPVSSAPEAYVHPGYITGTEEDIASILKLPVRRHSDVPDVGSGTQPEEVSDGSSIDGTGSWKRNA